MKGLFAENEQRTHERSQKSIDGVVRGVVLTELERFKSAGSAGSDIISLC